MNAFLPLLVIVIFGQLLALLGAPIVLHFKEIPSVPVLPSPLRPRTAFRHDWTPHPAKLLGGTSKRGTETTGAGSDLTDTAQNKSNITAATVGGLMGAAMVLAAVTSTYLWRRRARFLYSNLSSMRATRTSNGGTQSTSAARDEIPLVIIGREVTYHVDHATSSYEHPASRTSSSSPDFSITPFILPPTSPSPVVTRPNPAIYLPLRNQTPPIRPRSLSPRDRAARSRLARPTIGRENRDHAAARSDQSSQPELMDRGVFAQYMSEAWGFSERDDTDNLRGPTSTSSFHPFSGDPSDVESEDEHRNQGAVSLASVSQLNRAPSMISASVSAVVDMYRRRSTARISTSFSAELDPPPYDSLSSHGPRP